VCCIRNPSEPSDRDGNRIREIASKQDLDWDSVVDLAKQHRVIPFLHAGLQNAQCKDVLPAEKWQLIHKKYLSNAAVNTVLISEIVRLRNACATRDIEILPFKGPVMAGALYGDITFRTCDDLDILVREEDIEQARQILLDDGFEAYLDMTEVERHWHHRAGWEYMLRHPELGYLVELDTCIGPRYQGFNLLSDEIFEEPSTVRIDGSSIDTVNAETLLLMLCVHGSRHQWNRLVWVADILAMWRSFPTMSFSEIANRAKRLGVHRMLLLGHAVAQAVGDEKTALPEIEFSEKDAIISALADQCLAGWANETCPRLSGMGFKLASRERVRDKVLYMLGIACTPSYSDWKIIRLPRGLYPLYFLIRPCRLVVKAIKILIRKAGLPACL